MEQETCKKHFSCIVIYTTFTCPVCDLQQEIDRQEERIELLELGEEEIKKLVSKPVRLL